MPDPKHGGARENRIDVVLVASMLAAGATWAECLPHSGAKTIKSLQTVMSRKGCSQRHMRQVAIKSAVDGRITPMAKASRDSVLKQLVAATVEDHLRVLRQSGRSLFGPKQGKADVLHKLTQVAAAVEGWGESSGNTLIQLGIGGLQESGPGPEPGEKPAIDV